MFLKLLQNQEVLQNYDSATVKARLQSASGPILCPLITSGASGEESRLFYNSNNSAHLINTG